MRGCYKYAPLQIMIVKIVNQKKVPTLKDLVFIDGELCQSNASHLKLEALSAGEYLVVYSFDWTRLHPVRKTIFNFYYKPDNQKMDIKLQRLDDTQFGDELFEQLSAQLEERIKEGTNYKVQNEN